MKRLMLAAVFAALACACAVLHAADEEPAWRNVESPVEIPLRAVWLPDDDTIFACGDNGVVIASRDAGATWKTAPVPSKAALRGIHFAEGNQLRSLWFPDRKTGCAVGDAGAVIRTGDGGKTWTAAEKAVENRLDAVCIAGSSGWAMGSGGAIIGTSDCGKRWKKEDSPTSRDLFGLHVRGKTAVAVGDRGTVLVRRAK